MSTTTRPAGRSIPRRSASGRRSPSRALPAATPAPRRRRKVDPTTCDREYRSDEIEFMQALDAYKRASGRMFPTCSEILEVVRTLGYRRAVPG